MTVNAPLFETRGLRVAPAQGGEPILNGVDLTVGAGEVHALMGPNGSGKSTLAQTLLGSPEYKVTGGRVRFKGDDITDWATDVAGQGRHLPGLPVPPGGPGRVGRQLPAPGHRRPQGHRRCRSSRCAWRSWSGWSASSMDPAFADRYLNEGFSGGEKKRNEILQMAHARARAWPSSTRPTPASTSTRCGSWPRASRRCAGDRPEMGVLVITHYQRLLDHLAARRRAHPRRRPHRRLAAAPSWPSASRPTATRSWR